MKKYLNNLSKCVLFKGLDETRIEEILKLIPYVIKSYEKSSIIAIEGDDCNSLGIILEGNVEIHKPFPSGKIVTINHFSAGNVFGEALVFSGKHIYPATILATIDTQIMFIKREMIVKLMTIDEKILNNFMGVLSNRILMLNDRLTNLSLDTLRKKIANIIILEYKCQNSLNITLPYCRKKMAELLNIPRPSLSRELINMKEEGLIDFNKNKITILDLKGIEESLL
ncbi:Crp/Fnr family transcriptional regulator [Tissierella creatinophila]|uniref:Global nitrogen regulator n=1 Tax=Tissierella creatinophila DSM 6911 TaxID=1123403 RepID=A0A1U7M4F3_TISCR|nr:Crp/Fnr family transcriptional regulator [Tissierella creatinophila]OLS02099.1 global nitrogen regulator [Tissierella creatinophila DSM 6911]